MGAPKASKPTPAPEQAPVATSEQSIETTKEKQLKKKAKQFKLEDTVSIFNQTTDKLG